jgi:PAS domain S-box-containing protein
MVTVSDRAGQVVYANPATERVSGYAPEEFVARNTFDSIHPEDRPRCQEAFERLLATPGLSLGLEHRFRHKDGSWRWAEGTFEGLFDDPEIGGLVATVRDVTEKKRAEESLRESEERQAFLLELSDVLRPLSDAVEIQAEASRILGEHLRVERVVYVGIEGDEMVVRRDYTDGVPSMAGRYPKDAFGETSADAFRESGPYVLTDAETDARLSEAEKENYRAVNMAAYAGVTLYKEGKLSAGFAAHSATPREWTKQEVSLIEETAERTWAAVERARAEEALHASEEKYRSLFDSIDEGFCVFELLYDEKGKAVDYRFLEVNRVFERQTGLENAVGKLGSEIAPNTESHWLEVYDNVARTGRPQRIENYNRATERWYEAYASRIGGENSRQVCTVFDDITERKRRETNQRLLADISDELVELDNIAATMERLGEKIGRHFDVKYCMFAEHTDEFETAVVAYGWNDTDAPSIKGTYRVRDFLTDAEMAAVLNGEPLIVSNTQTDPRVTAESYGALNIHSFIIVPLVREREWRSQISIIDNKSRMWRDDEVELMRELTMRIWTRLQRARAEEALRDSEERYRTLVENVGAHAVFLLDADGLVTEWTASARRVKGYAAEEVVGRHVSLFYVPEEVEAGDPERELAEAAREGRAEREGWRVRKGGTRIWVNEIVTAVRDGKGDLVGFAKISRDLTERRELEEERGRARSRELTALAEAAERERISRELHDRVAHHMGVAHQSLELYSALREVTPERAAERLKLARETTRVALDQTRALSAELKRLQDEELKEGLEVAFGKIADSYVPDGTEMDVSFSGKESAIPGPVGTQVYLAMREAVRNAVKHSDCSRIGLTLEVLDGELHGLVEDDGEGFDVGALVKATPSWGVGLRSMRERAEMLGGSLRVESEPGAGTRVELRVPLNGRRS